MDKPVSEMVERVARAIWEDREQHQHPRCRQTWHQGSDLARKFAIDHAIAAIKAMREVSEPMKHIGGRIVANLSSGRAIDPYEEDAVNAYQAMIDAALGDTNAA